MLQAAFVLHSRPYRETSAIIEVLTEQQGRISLVAKGLYSKKNPLKAVLQPFLPLLIDYKGQRELKTLIHAEIAQFLTAPKGDALYAGFYINELITRLTPKEVDSPEIFALYQTTTGLLSDLGANKLEAVLRHFEFLLLEELGYGLDFTPIAELKDCELEQSYFDYVIQQGFVPRYHTGENLPSTVFLAKDLAKIAELDFAADETLLAAKRLIRMVLQPHLGNKPLTSRALFARTKQSQTSDK